ncbi:MAG: hypothetical protein AAF525_11515 [Pseudomonadota bacterium]
MPIRRVCYPPARASLAGEQVQDDVRFRDGDERIDDRVVLTVEQEEDGLGGTGDLGRLVR